MRANEYIYLAFGEVGGYLSHILGLAGAAEIFHPHGEVAQAVAEGGIVLKCEHRGGHQHCSLLAVDGSFEGSTDGYFSLAEAHVAAYQAVHRAFALHIGFHGIGSLELVGGIFVDKRSLEFVLHISVGREGKTFLRLACGIEANQVASYVLEFALGALLHSVPSAAAQFVEAWRLALFASIFREFVQRVNRHKHHIVVEIGEFYHFLRRAVDVGTHQSAEAAHAVVDVHHIVAHLYLVEFLERKRQFAAASSVALEAVFVETVENLMVGKDAQLQVVVDKSLMEGTQHGHEGDIVAAVVENGFQTVDLLLAVGKYHESVAVAQKVGKRLPYEFKILMIDALRTAFQRHSGFLIALWGLAEVIGYKRKIGKFAFEGVVIHHLAHGIGIVVLCYKGAARDGLTTYIFHSREHPRAIVAHHHGIGAYVVKQRHAA